MLRRTCEATFAAALVGWLFAEMVDTFVRVLGAGIIRTTDLRVAEVAGVARRANTLCNLRLEELKESFNMGRIIHTHNSQCVAP